MNLIILVNNLNKQFIHKFKFYSSGITCAPMGAVIFAEIVSPREFVCGVMDFRWLVLILRTLNLCVVTRLDQ